MSKFIKHSAEYLAVRTTAALVQRLPYKTALTIGWINAAASFACSGKRVQTAQNRIAQVFGNRFSHAESRHIAWLSWRNIVFNGIEMIRFPTTTREWLQSVADWEPVTEQLLKHSATGAGAIIAVPHMGNWDLAGIACHHFKIPIFSIAGRQRNPLIDAYMHQLRVNSGLDTVLRGSGTMRTVLRKIGSGGFLAILPDVRVNVESIQIPFLGGIANVGSGMAAFARHSNVPIFPCIVTRIGWDRHRVVMSEPLFPDKTLDKHEDISRMSTLVLDRIDAAIRAEPAQWFWFNKRWVLDPV